MNIRELRAFPALPEGYFEFREVLERRLTREALFARPSNVAIFHAVAALESMIWNLRPIAEMELSLRMAMGLPVEVGMYSMAIHGFGSGLTHLIRELHQRAAAAAHAVGFDPAILAEAQTALRTANGQGELLIVLGDVELGWRDCRVEGRTLRVPSKSPERMVQSFQRSLDLEAER